MLLFFPEATPQRSPTLVRILTCPRRRGGVNTSGDRPCFYCVPARCLQPCYNSTTQPSTCFSATTSSQPIAVGELLADARRGLEMQQQRLHASDSRLPLPAPLALSLLTAAAKLRTHLHWTPTSRHLIAQFRALLAISTNHAFFCRAESCVRYLTHDLVVDRQSKQIWLFIRKAKGD
jgi:hypothetical protein